MICCAVSTGALSHIAGTTGTLPNCSMEAAPLRTNLHQPCTPFSAAAVLFHLLYSRLSQFAGNLPTCLIDGCSPSSITDKVLSLALPVCICAAHWTRQQPTSQPVRLMDADPLQSLRKLNFTLLPICICAAHWARQQPTPRQLHPTQHPEHRRALAVCRSSSNVSHLLHCCCAGAKG
jgi:hypothetical protein